MVCCVSPNVFNLVVEKWNKYCEMTKKGRKCGYHSHLFLETPTLFFPMFYPICLSCCAQHKRVLFEVIYTTGSVEWEALSSTGQVKMLLLLVKGQSKTYWAMSNYETIFKISYKDQNRTKPEYASNCKNEIFVVLVKVCLIVSFLMQGTNTCWSFCPSRV